jgi:TPR repeat protein
MTLRHCFAVGAMVAGLPLASAGAEDFVDGLAAYDAGSYAETVRIWEPLATAGDPMAQLGLAALYRAGEGVPRDLDRARDLYRRAALQGNSDAQINLARLLIDGEGGKRDQVEAHAWLSLAAAASRRWARERLRALDAQMTLEQRAVAPRRLDDLRLRLRR